MSYIAKVYNVMIASPGDVSDERKIVREVISEWNNSNSFSKGVVLMPIDWEHNSSPSMGDRAQEIINKQVLTKADLLIGIFWNRIGTPTGGSLSGTVEEIEKHIATGKRTMLYFSDQPVVTKDLDFSQLQAVQKFKNDIKQNGLVGNYNSLPEFKQSLSKHILLEINDNPEIYFFDKKVKKEKFTETLDEDNKLLNQEEEEVLEALVNSKDGIIAIYNNIEFGNVSISNERYKVFKTQREKLKFDNIIKKLLDSGFIRYLANDSPNLYIIEYKSYEYYDMHIKK